MYMYNVTVQVIDERAEEWLQWMRDVHIPEVMATGYFIEHRLCRLVEEEERDGVTYAIQYVCESIDDFLEYRLTEAPALQEKTKEKFGNDFVAFRTLLEIL